MTKDELLAKNLRRDAVAYRHRLFAVGTDKTMDDAADCIERLQAEMEERERNHRISVNAGAYTIKQLQAELEASQRRERAAIAILNSIEWVGSGAKGRIEDAINVLQGPEQEEEETDV